MSNYKAKQGDIIWLDFDPQTGHEQKGRRPAIIISNNSFNNFSNTAALVCPITNTDKNIPIQIKLNNKTKTTGIIMCNQAKILDISKRNAAFIEKAPEDIILEAVDTIIGFVEIEAEELEFNYKEITQENRDEKPNS